MLQCLQQHPLLSAGCMRASTPPVGCFRWAAGQKPRAGAPLYRATPAAGLPSEEVPGGRGVPAASGGCNPASSRGLAPTRRRGRSWGRGGKSRRADVPQRPQQVKLVDVILQLQADGELPQGLSSPGYFDEFLDPPEPLEPERAASWEEAPPENVQVMTRFRVQKQTAFGEHVCVLGSCPELGVWDVQASVQLCWSDDHWWHGEAALLPGEHDFKFVVVKPAGDGQQLVWEACSNRQLQVGATSASIDYTTHWEHPPLPPTPTPEPLQAPPASASATLPTPACPAPSPPSPPPRRDYGACCEILAMFSAHPTSAADIGSSAWAAPAPHPSTTTAASIFSMVEAARLVPGPSVVTSQDAELVRQLGLGTCNLPSDPHARPPSCTARPALPAHAGAAGAASHRGLDMACHHGAAAATRADAVTTGAWDTLCKCVSATALLSTAPFQHIIWGQQLQQQMLPAHCAVQASSPDPSSHASRRCWAPAGSSAGPGAAPRSSTITRASVLESFLGPAPQQHQQQQHAHSQPAEQLPSHKYLPQKQEQRQQQQWQKQEQRQQQQWQQQQQQQQPERSTRHLAARLLAEHLGLGSPTLIPADAACRLVVVLESFACLSAGCIPRYLTSVQYCAWLVRQGGPPGHWHAAVRCALMPLADALQC